MNNTAEAPPLAAEQITLALDGVTVEGAQLLEDLIRLDVGQGLLQAALNVFEFLDPASFYSAIVLSRTHQLELVKRWPKEPDEARVEKYRSRGFTLVADPAIP